MTIAFTNSWACLKLEGPILPESSKTNIMSFEHPKITKCRWKFLKHHGRIQRVVGGPDPLPPTHEKITKNIGFLSKTGPDHLKRLLSYLASIQCWVFICPSAKHHLNGVSLAAVDDPFIVIFGSSITIASSTNKNPPKISNLDLL